MLLNKMLRKARKLNNNHDSSSSCQPKLEDKNVKDIMRPPSTSSSSEEENNNADIKPQILRQNVISSEKDHGREKRHKLEGEKRMASSHSSYTSSRYGGVNGFRLRKGVECQTQHDYVKSPKKRVRRSSSEEEFSELPLQMAKGKTDIFEGQLKKRNSQAVYGKGNQSISRSMACSHSKSHQKSSQPSPRKKLKSIQIPISDSETSDGDNATAFKPPCSEFLDLLGLDIPGESRSSVVDICDSLSVASRTGSDSDINFKGSNNQTLIQKNKRSTKFKPPQAFNETPPASFSEHNSSFEHTAQKEENESYLGSPSRPFKSYFGFDSEDDLLLTPPEPTSSDCGRYHVGQDIERSLSPTNLSARCPMCNELVCSDKLRNHGSMNIRQQEKFCLDHRKKTAKKQWEAKRYPIIDWGKLDGRISKHHAYLQNLINGANSYYRSILKAKIDQGIDRNQRSMASNLMPGYYGPRGLRIILENIFRAFTPLLKKRIVQDRLIAARGYTPYVQSVLVPEMATLLIQEDLLITLPEARAIMVESTAIGELLQEEVRDLEAPDDIPNDILDCCCL